MIGMTKIGKEIYFAYYRWYDLIEDWDKKSAALQEKGRIEGLKKFRYPKEMTFQEWVNTNFDDYTKLDRRLQWKLQKEWDELQGDYESHDKES